MSSDPRQDDTAGRPSQGAPPPDAARSGPGPSSEPDQHGSAPPQPNPYGMGPVGSGPGFAPPPAPAREPSDPYGAGPYGRAPDPVPATPRRRRSPWPAIVTAGVIAAVLVVLLVSTIRAGQVQTTGQGHAPSTPTPSALPSSSEDSIAFSSTEGSGRLTLVSHQWTSNGTVDPSTGNYLKLTVRISAEEGRISYGPQYFQVFDDQGRLYRTTPTGVRTGELDQGRLHAGDSTTGTIAFDMPRGTVTLLMSNALMETVTALRIVE